MKGKTVGKEEEKGEKIKRKWDPTLGVVSFGFRLEPMGDFWQISPIFSLAAVG